MKVLAFDIATKTGLAYGGAGDIPLTKVIDLGTGMSDSRRAAKAMRMAEGFIENRAPDFVAIECPIGPKASGILWMLYGCVLGQVEKMGVKHCTYQVSSIRKHFLGRNLTSRDYPGLSKDQARAEIKQVVMNRCRALGWQVDTDDEADACALLDYALAKHGAHRTPAGGLFDGSRDILRRAGAD